MTTSCVWVIIPALNEEASIGRVLAHLPIAAARAIVVDNGSTDQTAAAAEAAGARVIREPRRGYGAACLAGLDACGDADIIAFLDADFSEEPEQLTELLAPIHAGQADLVIGTRVGSGRPWHALAGTRFCVGAINLIWGTRYTDLGPFRAISAPALRALEMADRTWGWTIEMQVKAAERGLRTMELPVRTRPRIGQSKISGTVAGTLKAATRMLAMIVELWLTRHRRMRRMAGSNDAR
ncbi:MAG: glycosyltransferase family 2 protein [Acidobacteriota bacterium]